MQGDDAREQGTAGVVRYAAQTAVSVLFPFAPHITSELWEALGGPHLWTVAWPRPHEALLVRDTVTIVVQVNGKLRGRVDVDAGAADADVLGAARVEPKVAAALDGKQVVREVVVPGRLVNFVVK